MFKWRLLSDEEARHLWDVKLESFADCSPYQTYAWGEYRRALGWQPCRWAAFDEHGEVVAMMQGALRRYFGFGLVWCEGGPVGDLSVCDERLQSAIKHSTGLKLVYCRFRCDRERDIEDVLRLNAQGWSLPWSPITTSYSMCLDLSKDEDYLLAASDARWRQNVRRAMKNKLTIKQWLNPDPDEILSVYLSMQALKGLEEQHSREEIEQVLEHLRDRLVLYRCEDEFGELVSLGGSFVVGTRAGNWFSATTERGRTLRASYAIFWALIQHSKKVGVRFYDLAGIDPVRNPGVYRFKKGSGARPIEYLGEWDWASQPLCRWFGNWAIAKRSSVRNAAGAVRKSQNVDLNTVQPAPPSASGLRLQESSN
jgi:hypothetical protein